MNPLEILVCVTMDSMNIFVLLSVTLGLISIGPYTKGDNHF